MAQSSWFLQAREHGYENKSHSSGVAKRNKKCGIYSSRKLADQSQVGTAKNGGRKLPAMAG